MGSDGVRAAEGARNCPPLNSGSAVAPLIKRGVPHSQVTGHRSPVDFRIATGFARRLVEGERTSSRTNVQPEADVSLPGPARGLRGELGVYWFGLRAGVA